MGVWHEGRPGGWPANEFGQVQGHGMRDGQVRDLQMRVAGHGGII